MIDLIGLHGLPRSGKDSVASILTINRNYRRLSFADPLKEAASVLLNRPLDHCHGRGFDREAAMPEWGFSMRWFLQRLGTECMRQQISDDFWIRRMRSTVDLLDDQGFHKLVVTDVRFPNEANFVRLMGGRMVEVTRPGTESNGHISDQHIACDFTISNDSSMDALASKVFEAFPR